MNPLGLFDRPVDEGRAVNHLAPGLCEGLAHFCRDQDAQIAGMFQDQVIPSPQDTAAFEHACLAPGLEGLRGGRNCGLCTVLAHIVDLRQFFAVGRIMNGKPGAAGLPLAVDEGQGAQQRRVIQAIKRCHWDFPLRLAIAARKRLAHPSLLDCRDRLSASASSGTSSVTTLPDPV